MSNKNKNDKNSKQVIIVRVFCIVLALLMLGGVIAAAIMSAQAVDIDTDTGETSQSETGETELNSVFSASDYLIRVGISYGDGTLDSHRVRTHKGAPGFALYRTGEGNSLKYIWTLNNNDVTVSETGNLRKSSGSDFYYYASSSNAAAGGYHLQLLNEYDKAEDAEEAVSALSDAANQLEVPVFPAYINDKYYIRVGAFTSSAQAESERAVIEEALGSECHVTSPTQTALTIIDYKTAKVLFDFDMGDLSFGLGLYCLEYKEGKDYIKTYRGYYYDGVMEFKRYKASSVDGVSMILISELETYVTCVVPWEIYNSWPTETMKAFSICARTFAIANSHGNAKHASYGFDVCDSSDCQVCKGFDRVNENVINGVKATEGQILLCDGETVTTYYTDLGGGSLAAAHEVWNMASEKYLIGQMTPWEDLTASKYGYWEFTATPAELLEKMHSAGYTNLQGAIADIRINRLCENSTYVYSITVIDTYGTSVTINRCRNVRLALSGLMYAANFVIEHNGRVEDGINHELTETVSGIYVMTGDGIKTVDGEERINVITENGIKQQYLPERITVKTSSSLVSQTVLIETGKIIGGGTGGTSSDFKFIGHGNGHGVGASQWGSKDLGNLGYTYDQILYTYYPHTELANYKDFTGE